MSVVGECFFWYRLTRVVPDKFHRAVNGCVCVCVCDQLNQPRSGEFVTLDWYCLQSIVRRMA